VHRICRLAPIAAGAAAVANPARGAAPPPPAALDGWNASGVAASWDGPPQRAWSDAL